MLLSSSFLFSPANRAEKTPGWPSRESTQMPESSAIAGRFVCLDANLALIKAFSILLSNKENSARYGRQDIIIDEYTIGENPILLYWSMDEHGNVIDGGIDIEYTPGTVVSLYCPNNIIYFRFLSSYNELYFAERMNTVPLWN